jgi:DNA-binding NarL/FixJ family response regulator
MNKVYRIILVDDHKIFREGVSFVLSQLKDFRVAGEASNGKEFLEMLDYTEADIVLMDISMPVIDGLTATTMAMAKYPDIKIIALTMSCDKEYFNKMVQAGISGFLLKESGKEELVKALNAVKAGETYFSQNLLHKIILKSGPYSMSSPLPRRNEFRLTLIESQILKLTCQGLTSAQIAEKLSMSIRNIENCRNELMNKTGSKNCINLAVFALKNNLVDID